MSGPEEIQGFVETHVDDIRKVHGIPGIAVAAFWFAIMLQLLFSMQLDWLPLRGRNGAGVVLRPGSPQPVRRSCAMRGGLHFWTRYQPRQLFTQHSVSCHLERWSDGKDTVAEA